MRVLVPHYYSARSSTHHLRRCHHRLPATNPHLPHHASTWPLCGFLRPALLPHPTRAPTTSFPRHARCLRCRVPRTRCVGRLFWTGHLGSGRTVRTFSGWWLRDSLPCYTRTTLFYGFDLPPFCLRPLHAAVLHAAVLYLRTTTTPAYPPPLPPAHLFPIPLPSRWPTFTPTLPATHAILYSDDGHSVGVTSSWLPHLPCHLAISRTNTILRARTAATAHHRYPPAISPSCNSSPSL